MRSRNREPGIAKVAAVGVDADLVVSAGPVDPADVEPEINVGLVVGHPQGAEVSGNGATAGSL